MGFEYLHSSATSKFARIGRRAYVAMVLPMWWAAILLAVTTSTQAWFVVALILTPLAAPAILMIGSWQVFGLAHSALGWESRGPLPSEAPLETVTTPKVTCLLFASGIGFRLLAFGDVFVRDDQIQGIASDGLNAEIHHTSTEIRSPIHVPPAIAKLVHERRPRAARPS